MGLLEKNENKIPEMLEILQHCNEEYVPTNDDKSKILHKILVGGDHLTVEQSVQLVLSMLLEMQIILMKDFKALS